MDLLLTLCYEGRIVLIISSNWEPDLAVATAASSETVQEDSIDILSGTGGF
jgi:hypothetical protein